VIASLASNFIERYIVESGFSYEAVRHDYGYDLMMFTYDSDGYTEEGLVYLQIKASDSLSVGPDGCIVPIDVRDYNIWVDEPMPVFLIAFDATARKGYWLYVQHYFETDSSRRPNAAAATVRVRIPRKNTVDASFVRYAQARKADVLLQLVGRTVHHG
jgi:hypothetical protein